MTSWPKAIFDIPLRSWRFRVSICRTISELLPNSLFLRAVHRNFDRSSQGIQRIYQIQKSKITQGDCLHPSYRFCIRLQVPFRTREKIEGLDPQTVFSFLGSKSMDIKKYRQGAALSKNREDGPKMGYEIKSMVCLSSRKTKRPKHVLCQGLTPFFTLWHPLHSLNGPVGFPDFAKAWWQCLQVL